MEVSSLDLTGREQEERQELKALGPRRLAERCSGVEAAAASESNTYRSRSTCDDVILICIGIVIFVIAVMSGADKPGYAVTAFLGLAVAGSRILSLILFSWGLNSPHARYIRMEEYSYRAKHVASRLSDDLSPDAIIFYREELRELEILVGVDGERSASSPPSLEAA